MLVILTLKDQMNNYKKDLKNVAIHLDFLISINMLEKFCFWKKLSSVYTF